MAETTAQGIPAPTTVQKKKVLLELYSGVNCQYCPTGDRIAEQLTESNPGNVIILDIQTGIYAEPNAGQPDYRTPFGDGLENLIDLTGYPAGTINRHVFPGWGQQPNGLAMAPTYWNNAVAQILAQDAAANLGVEAELDVQTKLLTVNVEVYYTGNPPTTSNRLNVAILQDNIIGPQIIGSTVTPDPDLVLPNGLYIHNNMLRHLMTGQFGTVISPAVAGSRIPKTYAYQIPANDSIYKVPAVLGDLEVVVFVTENTKEVINVERVKPTLTNFLHALDAKTVEAGIASTPVCGEYINTPTIKFMNNGSQTLTSLLIDYTINGSIHKSYQWAGSLPPLSEQQITLDPIRYYPLETVNTLTVTIRLPNGGTDQNTSNDTAAYEFASAPDASSTVNMTLQLDYWGSEVKWRLVNSADEVLYSGGPYSDVPNPNTNPPLPAPITQTFSLLPGHCYKFVAIDSFGDGILGNNTGFTLIDDEGLVIVSRFASYGYEGSVSFGVDAPKVDSSDVFTSVAGAEVSERIHIYPNPALGNISIQLPSIEFSDWHIYLANALGQTIRTIDKERGTRQVQMDVAGLSPGIYFVNVITGEKRYAKKLLIAF